jgi:hypothetical protein
LWSFLQKLNIVRTQLFTVLLNENKTDIFGGFRRFPNPGFIYTDPVGKSWKKNSESYEYARESRIS